MATLGDLQRFKDSMSANVNELTSYEGGRLKFDGLVAHAQALTREQAAQTAAKQETSKKLQDVLNEAKLLATVLRFAVKEHFGRDSEKLVEFGLQPFRGRTRKPKPETPAPDTTPSAE